MSLLQNSNAISSGVPAYPLSDSLRFRASASAYLSRTFTTPTNNTIWSLSCWIKRSDISTQQFIINTNSYCGIGFIDNKIRFWNNAGSDVGTSTAVFRDPSAWYHLVVRSNGSTIIAYINNTSVLSYSGTITNINSAISHNIGRDQTGGGNYFDGYITEFNFIDGQSLDPSEFGRYNADTGVWEPKEYTGSYGTNGFYLNMSTSGSTVTDQSGNGNNWTANNMDFSNTTAHTYDKMTDVPTLTDEDTSNFPTLNPLTATSLANVINAAQTFTWNTASENGCHASMMIPKTGKWYWEVYINNQQDGYVGISQPLSTSDIRIGNKGWYLRRNGWFVVDGTQPSGSGTGWGAGSTVRLLIDSDNNQLQTYVDNTANSVVNYDFTTNDYFAQLWMYNATMSINFGQRPFKYAIPSGYKKLNAFNIADSQVLDGSQYMNTVLWNGNGTGQSITGVGFQPDWIWIKQRSSNTGLNNHRVYDSVRDIPNSLDTNTTDAEKSFSAGLQSFDSDGFTVGTGGVVNNSAETYVGWSWRASDSAPVTNNDGTITSTVSANPTAGFSVVSYTGNSTNGATIGHGLGVAPKIVIVKNRDGGWQWIVDISNITGTTHDHLILNSTAAKSSSDTYYAAKPTSTVFSVNGASYSDVGTSPYRYIAYCFAEVEGYSKFGTYIGNGSANGAFVYTGFRPAFVITKVATGSTVQGWLIRDSERDPYNVSDTMIPANTSSADINNAGAYGIDLLSNGFKVRGTDGGVNQSGGTLIYMAFAENPFKNSLAR